MANGYDYRTDNPLLSPLATRIASKQVPAGITPPNSPQIVDQWGRQIFGDAFDVPREKPVDRNTATVTFRDVPIISSLTGNWSLPLIKQALFDQMRGQFILPAELADEVSGDDRVQATIGSRVGGLFSQPLIHKGGSRECRRAWKKAWKKLIPQSVASELMTWAVLVGFAVAEVLWDDSVAPWQPILKVWHPRNIWYRWDIRKYVAITLDGLVEINPGDGKWFLFTPHGAYRGWVRGVIRSIATKWYIKGLAWRDWARFNERHGLPIIKAKVPAAGDINQKANFIQAMAKLGQEAVIGLPQNVDGTGYDAELLEARDRAWESFQGTIDRCDRSIVLPILGQNLTTEVTEGSYAAARQHGDIRQDYLQFDNATLSEGLYQQVARPYAELNFGDPNAAPETAWVITPTEDYLTKAQTFYAFAQAVQQLRLAGKEVDVAKLAPKFGLSIDDVTDADPTQVEAKQAGAGNLPSDSQVLRSIRREVKELRAEIERRAA